MPIGLKNPSKSNKRRQRLTVAAIFGLTLLLTGLMAVKDHWRRFWQTWHQPVVISSFDPSPVLDQIRALTDPLLGTYGVYVYNLTSGHQYGLAQKEAFPMASLVKLPVILTLYQEAEADRINLEDQYTLQEADKRGGAGILQAQPAGNTYTYRQLAQLMGHYSDNTAYNVLLGILSWEKIQATVDRLGMTKTVAREFTTTPEDTGLFFQQLYEKDLVNDWHRQEIFKFLTATAFEDRIPAGVPEGTRVVHKVGTEIGNFADAGIVFGPQPFVLVVITKDARESEAMVALPQISRLVWEFETAAGP